MNERHKVFPSADPPLRFSPRKEGGKTYTANTLRVAIQRGEGKQCIAERASLCYIATSKESHLRFHRHLTTNAL